MRSIHPQGRRGVVAATALAVFVGALVAAPAALANEYEDDDFGLRLASSFIRFTEVSAFGGETCANRWSPAVNPAAADWTPMTRRWGIALAPYWSHIEFDSGNLINLYGEAGVWDTRRIGTFQPAFSQLRSNTHVDRTGMGFDYETDTFQLQWGKRQRNWAIGTALNINTSTVVRRAGGLTLSRSEAETYRIRLGGLWSPPRHCRWLFGGVAEYGWSPIEFSALAPVGPVLVPITGEDTQDQWILRGGASYLYDEMSAIYADYQFGRFASDRGSLEVHRLSAGVQGRVLRPLFLRGGATVDHHGNVGLMAGASLGFARWGSLHFGYQFDVLPELNREFGVSNTFQLTLSIEL